MFVGSCKGRMWSTHLLSVFGTSVDVSRKPGCPFHTCFVLLHWNYQNIFTLMPCPKHQLCISIFCHGAVAYSPRALPTLVQQQCSYCKGAEIKIFRWHAFPLLCSALLNYALKVMKSFLWGRFIFTRDLLPWRFTLTRWSRIQSCPWPVVIVITVVLTHIYTRKHAYTCTHAHTHTHAHAHTHAH